MFFRFGKQRQGFLPRGSVDAVSRRLHHPLAQLSVGVGQGAKLPQGNKTILDIINNPTLPGNGYAKLFV